MNDKVLNEALKLISEFLVRRRNELGISQSQLAEQSGIGIATIKRFESGRSWINMKQYLILCHYLKCYPFIAEMEGKDEFAKMMRNRWKRPHETQ